MSVVPRQIPPAPFVKGGVKGDFSFQSLGTRLEISVIFSDTCYTPSRTNGVIQLEFRGGNGEQILTIWSVKTDGSPFRVWPDGCRDLIVYAKPTERPTAFLTGLDTGPYCVQEPAGTLFIGVRLTPGSVAKWESKVEARPCERLQLDHLGRLTASWLEEVFRHADRVHELLAEAAESWFRTEESMVQSFLRTLDQTPGRIPPMGMSSRTLRRHIRALTGASPRFWVGLHRARIAGSALVHGTMPISDIALAAGYADQAHLTRELRRWFGVTPAAMRRDAALHGRRFTWPDAFSTREDLAGLSTQFCSTKYCLNSAEGSISW